MVAMAYESDRNGDPFDGILKPEEFQLGADIRTEHVFDPLVTEDGLVKSDSPPPGFKLTDVYGGCGVICKIHPDEDKKES
jgi:hypothetical protein